VAICKGGYFSMRLIFDIETNGLLNVLVHMWMLQAYDQDTGDRYIFSTEARRDPGLQDRLPVHKVTFGSPDPTPPHETGLQLTVHTLSSGAKLYVGDTEEFLPFFRWYEENSRLSLTGHFIVGYDLPALKKLYGYVPAESTTLYDTMVMSQVLDYKRFGMRGHSLALWGEYFGKPKPEHENWSEYSTDMLWRCWEDVGINLLVMRKLSGELQNAVTKHNKTLLPRSLRVEHDVLHFCALAEEHGWPFDRAGGQALLKELETKMGEVEAGIIPRLRPMLRVLDKEPREPKWLKSGIYDRHTARYFGIAQEEGLEDFPLIVGPYQRFEYVQANMGNLDAVKELLDSLGWVPDDWNWRKGPSGEPVRGTPKFTTTSLLPLGEVGEQLDRYYTLRSRHQILHGWLENLDANDRLHGACFTIATPTGRARHSGIVNVPAADGKSLYGAEMRKLFVSLPGWSIVGADSSGNQMRAFCHYLGNDAYTKEVIDGDVHSANMRVLQEVVPDCTRSKAKPFLYAFLFGGGSEKLALILIGKREAKIGKRAKDIFMQKTPGLKGLVTRILKIFDRTKETSSEGWIPAIDGRRIYVDSPHKALNYLLQSCEGVTCKAAVSLFMQRMKLELPHVPYVPLIFYHDEFEVMVPDEYAEQVRVIAKECFRDAPKQFGVMIMDGESKVGKSWYDVH
jgi:DNA polymerase-1